MNPIDIALLQATDDEYDLGISPQQDLVLEDGLETAVIISLFTDARCDPSELPYGQTDLRGWWGDAVDPSGDQTGSKLWLLERATASNDTLARAREFCQSALGWMVDDQIAQSVTVSTSLATNEEMLIQVSIQKPDGTFANFQYLYAWTQQLQEVS